VTERDTGGKAVDPVEVLETSPNLPVRQLDGLPSTLPILISTAGPIFPGMMSPVALLDKRAEQTAEQAGLFVGIVAVRPGAVGEGPLDVQQLYEVGCAARLMQKAAGPDGQPTVIVRSISRLQIRRYIKTDTVLLAEVDYPDEIVRDAREVEALHKQAIQSFRELVRISPEIPDEVLQILDQATDPGQFADFVAFNLGKDVAAKQGILTSFEVDGRLRSALALAEKDLDLAQLGAKLRDEIREKMEGRQREHYLREQLKAIRRELGDEVDQPEQDRETYLEKIEAAGMPEVARERAIKELGRLTQLPAEASEHHVIRNYLDWLVELPWSAASDEELDVGRAVRVLDEDHHGLREVKDRIVEFLAVRKLRPEQHGAIICLVGPPGVGKTSLGRSVARAMGREFYRLSLGGMRDEAEIRGHRRTYVGAMPGKIIQGLRRVKTRNPVFMLDELDKLSSDGRGDPSSALLEVLDPAQNNSFEDLYIDLPFDLSRVMFIATANVAAQIPRPLLDRTELITLSGYIPSEKQAIGRTYLLPRQLAAHGIDRSQLKVGARAMAAVVDRYTREAGVRELERVLGRVCRKVAARVAALPEGMKPPQVTLTPDNMAEFLGPRRYFTELVQRVRQPGVVVGLAWTSVGGEILFVEATSMPGRGGLQLTGRLGDVMSESAHIALSLVRSRASQFGIPDALFRERAIHLHVPSGAVPKDGPSAGVAMTCALLSLLWRGTGRAAKARVAMTGEITLRGAVLPVGGLREKVIGAKRAGIKTIVVPGQNRPDVEEIPEAVKRGLKFVYADEIDEAVTAVIARPTS
jgi:ATP-dependent Lon protease